MTKNYDWFFFCVQTYPVGIIPLDSYRLCSFGLSLIKVANHDDSFIRQSK